MVTFIFLTFCGIELIRGISIVSSAKTIAVSSSSSEFNELSNWPIYLT